jgi:uncharacterized protein
MFKEHLPVRSVEASRQPHRDLAFFADSMHGSLARKLRIFGIDTAYSNSISDNQLLMECGNQRRILLTSDKELFKRALNKQIGSVHLNGHSDKENMIKILGECNVSEILFDSAFARCPTCNLVLEKKEKGEINDSNNLIPPKSYFLYSHFYRCSRCRKIYWEGSHKPALISLAASVNQVLQGYLDPFNSSNFR